MPGAAISKVISAVIIVAAVLLVCVGVGGDIEYTFGDDALTVHTRIWKDVTVAYSDVESVEYADTLDVGRRTNGYGASDLNVGHFENDAFGKYLLYSYTDCDRFAVLHLKDGTVLALNCAEPEATEELYQAICGRVKK